MHTVFPGFLVCADFTTAGAFAVTGISACRLWRLGLTVGLQAACTAAAASAGPSGPAILCAAAASSFSGESAPCTSRPRFRTSFGITSVSPCLGASFHALGGHGGRRRVATSTSSHGVTVATSIAPHGVAPSTGNEDGSSSNSGPTRCWCCNHSRPTALQHLHSTASGDSTSSTSSSTVPPTAIFAISATAVLSGRATTGATRTPA
mmetsp:Transcript_42564/g.79898  ORF Transcript_42564/g.79898 Transcript_42564/m.79898 type:complete len:206 (-) Transcript_42564:164-781(-)